MVNRLQGFLQKGVIRFPRAYAFIKSKPGFLRSRTHRRMWLAFGFLALALSADDAHASIFKGEALDKVADVLTWVVLVIAPIIGIIVFLLIHILPEKIAEKREHPQAKAIQCLCLLSLVFGGLLWPLAWLWAYTKPVFHKLAYGVDKAKHDEEVRTQQLVEEETQELKLLRQRIAELEAKQSNKPNTEGGKT
jgi:CBS domain containing-hemolysin-like protein